MEHPEERYYKLNKFFLSVTGLWPYQSARTAYLMRTIITISMMSSAFVQLSSFFTSNITMEYLVDIIPTLLPVLGSLIHLYIRVKHTDKLRELLNRMWNDWALQKTEDELKIMHEYAEISRLLTLHYSLQMYAIVVIYIVWVFTPEILDVILPMNESRPSIRPFNTEYIMFHDAELNYFYFLRSYEYSVVLLLPLIFIASTVLFLAVTLHVCGMCKLLGYRAERLFCVKQDATRYDLISRTKINYGNIAVLIRLHYNVIQFVGIIETYHTIPFAVDFLGLVIVMTLTLTQVYSQRKHVNCLFQILTFSGDINRAVRSSSFCIAQFIYLFIYNYMAQKLTDMTSSVCETVYNSAWYDAVVLEQKSLLLIMRRRFHPLILTACKFYAMSLQNFGMILQTTMTYCMFLRQV
ncbi:odorant receptor 13a-like [Linepithema humile]|uniref:odorant receptor 13a-like n=1 Tax=Linepithema humile TaxID=83485 RepID=UPI00351E7D55